MKVPTQILNLTRKPFVYIEDPEYIIVYAYMQHMIHMDTKIYYSSTI